MQHILFHEALEVVRSCLSSGKKLLICGNGGSAAQASHFAAELVVRFKKPRPPMAAISLAADCVVITAAANDLGVEWIFARQVEALGLPGDVLIALSTSGKSPNILKAIEIAHSSGLLVIGFSGGNGMQAYCDVDLAVASTDTARIQEAHLQLIHKICQALDE